MTWFKGLPDGLIKSRRELCEEFTSHFTARRRQPKTLASLNVVVQGKNETR
ncbi:hypothetical protein A2U01_0073491, partial [Trifolium medium]|nr:hypothetical protein [Trifolium medium]